MTASAPAPASSLPALALLAGAALLCAAPGAHALEPDKLFEKVSRSVVLVINQGEKGPQATGSGVVVGPQRVITNCHVLRQAKQVEVKLGNTRHGAQLLYPDVERDLCMLEVKDLVAPAVEITALSNVRIGQKTYAVGAPRGLELTLTDGLVSSIRGKPGEQLIQTSAPISRGSSGGGLFDDSGRLIGVTSGLIESGQNLNFAIPAEYIRELPERGQAALQKYRQQQQQQQQPAPQPSMQAQAPGAPAPSPAPDGARAPRQLTADELGRHIAAAAEFSGQLSNGTRVKFEWTWGNGYSVASQQSSDRLTGTRSLQGAQVCLRQANTLTYRPGDLLPLSGSACYDVLQTGARSYVWRGRLPTEAAVLSYTLP